MPKRIEIEFIGNVHGVGFRYTTQSIARRHPVVGYVKNLPNGNVEVVAEGEEAALIAFLQEIREKMAYHIDREQIAWM
ncbi:MAG: acylphosphatase, partial [Candidatus Margulisiibacteriota bacterium]